MKSRNVLAALALAVLGAITPNGARAARADAEPTQQWRFRVLLDGREVGRHDFVLRTEGSRKVLRSEAALKVKLLFVTAYEYRHEAVEVWDDRCLASIQSRTDDNGRTYEVRGASAGNQFLVESRGARRAGPSCVSSFAYWNPEFLERSSLLNSQTGELVAVEVQPLGGETFPVRGAATRAERYRLKAPGMAIDLWYAPGGSWLGLESQLEGGRRLRYELL